MGEASEDFFCRVQSDLFEKFDALLADLFSTFRNAVSLEGRAKCSPMV